MKLILAIIGSVVAVQGAQISATQEFGLDMKENATRFHEYETVQVSTDLLNRLYNKVDEMKPRA